MDSPPGGLTTGCTRGAIPRMCTASVRPASIMSTMSTAMEETSGPSASSNTSSRLVALPGETISNIAARLGSDDCFALRLTCRDLEAKTLHGFATEYFSNKGFIFTTDSLKVLVHVAESERLRKYMHTVHFVTAYFPERQNTCSNGCACLAAPTVRQSEAYADYMADQKKLKTTGEDKKMLAHSFRHLHKLATIRITDRFHLVGKDVDIRGLNKVRRVTGLPPPTPMEGPVDPQYLSWLSHVWKAVMVAIAYRPLPSLGTLSLFTKTNREGLSVNDLNLNETTISGVCRTFCNLKRLDLCIRGRSKVSPATLSRLPRFGSMFTNLEDLRLSFDYSKPAALLDWKFLVDANVAKITTFHVDGLKTSSNVLCTLFARMTAVKEVFITWTNITSGTWIEVLAALQRLSDLKHLHLQWLAEGNRKAYFLKQTELMDDEMDDDFFATGFPTMPAAPPPASAPTANNAASTAGAQAPTSRWTDSEDGMSDDSMPALLTAAELGLAPNEDSPSVHVGDSDEEGDADDDDDNENESEDDYDDYDEDEDDAEDEGVLLEPPFPPINDSAAANQQQSEPDFKAPGHEGYAERGYYVCLVEENVATYLPRFIEEYNLGQDFSQQSADAADFFAAAMGAHAAVPPGGAQAGAAGPIGLAGLTIGNTLLNNAFAGLFGAGPGGPPPPMPLGGGPGGHGNGHGHGHGQGG